MIRIGKIAATHGLAGQVILVHIASDSKWLKKNSALQIELNRGSYIPYFATTIQAKGKSEYILTLDDITTIEKAKALTGKNVYVSEETIEQYAAHLPLLWIDFEVKDKVKGSIGRVVDVIQTPAQWLATVNYNGHEVLIPLIEQIIEQIDLTNKILRVSLPAGLIEVYTG